MAAQNATPLAWSGTDAELLEGWDAQFEQSVADLEAGRAPTSLGALPIVVAARRQGEGLSGRRGPASSSRSPATT